MSIVEARQWIADSHCIVGFTGAGVSTESGIPDFRSPNGVWARNRTVFFEEFCNNEADRIEYWRQKVESWPPMREATPNLGHQAFADLARLGKLQTLITQNIDGLHQRAGLDPSLVLELHGTMTEVYCLNCKDRISMNEAVKRVEKGELTPKCRNCQDLLKPATISFGQALPVDVLGKAQKAAESCELFLAVGSSLVVEPAASLPIHAKQFGAKLIIINRTETPLDRFADLVMRDEIGKVLPRLVEMGKHSPSP